MAYYKLLGIDPDMEQSAGSAKLCSFFHGLHKLTPKIAYLSRLEADGIVRLPSFRASSENIVLLVRPWIAIKQYEVRLTLLKALRSLEAHDNDLTLQLGSINKVIDEYNYQAC